MINIVTINSRDATVNNAQFAVTMAGGVITVAPATIVIYKTTYSWASPFVYVIPTPTPTYLTIWLGADKTNDASLITDDGTSSRSFNFSGSGYTNLMKLAWASSADLTAGNLTVTQIVPIAPPPPTPSGK